MDFIEGLHALQSRQTLIICAITGSIKKYYIKNPW